MIEALNAASAEGTSVRKVALELTTDETLQQERQKQKGSDR